MDMRRFPTEPRLMMFETEQSLNASPRVVWTHNCERRFASGESENLSTNETIGLPCRLRQCRRQPRRGFGEFGA